MAVINEFFDEFQGMIWVQPDGPNTEVDPFLCADTDSIDEPLGDFTTRLCRQADGTWKTVNRSQGTPGEITFDIVTWKARQRNWLQRQVERHCSLPIYFQHAFCGRSDVFLNYDQGKLIQDAGIISKGYSNMARGMAEPGDTPEKTGQTFGLTAGPPSPEYYKLVNTLTEALKSSVAEDAPLRDIAFCTTPQCAGPCGAARNECDAGSIVADFTSTDKADGYHTVNNAGSWAAWVEQPFATEEDIASVVCYDIDRDTNRLLAACGTAGAAGLRVAYSDDVGATAWTPVVVDVSNTDYAAHSGALFALDHRHIWLCTFEADIYFSSDGGLTWTDQEAPTPGSNEVLNYVHFIDENYGWAVGGYRSTPTGLFLQTTDGGVHWALATVEPKVEMGVWVAVLDAYKVWVGLDDGTVYFSNDWGATAWTRRVLPLTFVNTGDVMFIDHYCGFVCGYYNDGADDHAVIQRTFNGGADWEYFVYPTAFDTTVEYFGLNAIWVCSYNEAHAVGEMLSGGHSIIWTLKPTAW